jgi:hypothetical protein
MFILLILFVVCLVLSFNAIEIASQVVNNSRLLKSKNRRLQFRYLVITISYSIKIVQCSITMFRSFLSEIVSGVKKLRLLSSDSG